MLRALERMLNAEPTVTQFPLDQARGRAMAVLGAYDAFIEAIPATKILLEKYNFQEDFVFDHGAHAMTPESLFLFASDLSQTLEYIARMLPYTRHALSNA